MKTSDYEKTELLRAFPDAQVDFWDQDFVNGKYIISYVFDPSLHQTLQNLLPKVCSLLKKIHSSNG